VLHTAIPHAYLDEVGTIEDLRAHLGQRPWDLVLVEISLTGGNPGELISMLASDYPSTRVLIVTVLPEAEYAIPMFKAGAHGYITKQRPIDELVQAVKTVLGGGNALSDEVIHELTNPHGSSTRFHDALSSRELAVLRFIAQGRPVKQIAHELSISEKTVATYIARIRQKTGLHNSVDMTRYALRHHLID
jgi:two-component system invasion response regulator UvrY